jgi:3-oxoacyl-[acyl-carrier-protein] synthase II
MRSSAAAAGHELGLGGPNIIISTACSASNYAIGYGLDLLREGLAKVMFCGGSEAFSRVIFTGFNRLFVMSPDKCRPFDKNRKGLILGEGSAVLVLETLEGAMERNAFIYAEVLGYGLSCDAMSMTIPSKSGIKKAIETAITNSGITKKDVDYINAHGTGTINNDRAESAAIRDVFGRLTGGIPVSSIKSMIGHTLGAAGAIEAASCCLAIRDGIVPPNINFETPDPECRINVAANRALKKKIGVAINNSFAFGGNNACVVFGKLK